MDCLQVQALQQAVMKIGEHMSSKGGGDQAAPGQGPSEYDAEVKDDKKDDDKK